VPGPAAGAVAARGRTALLALLLVVLVGLAYAPVRRAGFVWDDDDYVVLNDLLVEDGGLAQIWNPFSPRNPQYYPLVFTTFRVERALFGLDPTGYHVDNVLLHAATAVCLYLLLRRVGFRGAWPAAAVFALHPVHVESVAWVAERKNVLSGLLYVLAAHAWLSFESRRRWRWYALALVCFVLALASKTVTASLPIALALLLWWKRGRVELRQAATLAPMLVLGFVMGLLTRQHEYQHVLSADTELNLLTPLDRVLIAGRALWFYPSKLLWPRDLAFIYERWHVSPAVLWQWAFPLAAAAALVALVVLYKKGLVPRGPVAAVAFYGATIFPALGFVNVAPMRFAYVADHFQYLASIGILLLVVGGLRALVVRTAGARAGPVLAGGTALLVVGLALGVRREVRHYHDLGTLWARTAVVSPTNPMVLNSYANWLRKQTDPDLYEAYVRLGDLCGMQDRYEQAADAYTRLLARDPPPAMRAHALVQLGFTLGFLGRPDEALERFGAALAIDPRDVRANQKRVDMLLGAGRFAEAVAALRAAAGAVVDPAPFRHQLAWVLATAPDAGVRDAGEALSIARALLSDPPSPVTLRVLAAAQAESGDFETALATARRAQALARGPLQDLVRAQVRAYERGEPTRWTPGS
jgi:protein O-mannosyl-transferase